jgi:hypothetical protein
VAVEELLHLIATFLHGFSWPLLLCVKEESEVATFGGILAGTGIASVFACDEHTKLYFELVQGAVIWALNIAWQMLRDGKVAKVTCKNHLIQKASSLGILLEARIEREMLECQKELADLVKEHVKKEDAKNLEAELHRDMLQRGQGWRILDLMAIFGWSRVHHGSSWSLDSAPRISWVVLLEMVELLFQRKGRDVITELHFFHSISTLRARCLKWEGNVTSSLAPAHVVMTWRVKGVNSILLVGFGFQILLGCEAIVGGTILRESCINGEKGEREGIHLVIQS